MSLFFAFYFLWVSDPQKVENPGHSIFEFWTSSMTLSDFFRTIPKTTQIYIV